MTVILGICAVWATAAPLKKMQVLDVDSAFKTARNVEVLVELDNCTWHVRVRSALAGFKILRYPASKCTWTRRYEVDACFAQTELKEATCAMTDELWRNDVAGSAQTSIDLLDKLRRGLNKASKVFLKNVKNIITNQEIVGNKSI